MGPDEKQQIKIWAQKIKASDEAAFSALFRRLYPRLIKFSWQYTKTKTSAKDIVQESFVKLWEVRSTIDPEQSLMAYLFQIVRNRSLNYLRDHSTHYSSLNNAPAEKMEAEVPAPGAESDDNVLGKKMLRWIDALPDRQNEAIRLSRFDGLDHEEIACVMNISPRTVNNHIVKALNTLRAEWNAYKDKHPNGYYYDE